MIYNWDNFTIILYIYDKIVKLGYGSCKVNPRHHGLLGILQEISSLVAGSAAGMRVECVSTWGLYLPWKTNSSILQTYSMYRTCSIHLITFLIFWLYKLKFNRSKCFIQATNHPMVIPHGFRWPAGVTKKLSAPPRCIFRHFEASWSPCQASATTATRRSERGARKCPV